MGLPVKLPVSARPTLTSNIFRSTFNIPTIGRYDFTNVAGNQNQTVLTMTGTSIYVIERVCFSTGIPEGIFQESIDATAHVPWLRFKTLKTDHQIFDRPLPFINYVDNLELLLYIPGNQSEDEIQVTFEAVLFQIFPTVSAVNVNAYLQLNIYEVQNDDWVTRFFYDYVDDQGVRPGFHRTKPRPNQGTFG